MMIYSVSCTVNASESETWEAFFVEKHLDDVVNTGCFKKYTFKKLQSETDHQVTFVSEYYYETAEDLERYNEQFAPALKTEIGEKFAGKFTCQRAIFSLIS